MLLDLGRNDVGRVGEDRHASSSTEQFIIERYSHVMHIVSNVDGTLADGQDALDALLAGLPAGTVSGAPKVRAMEIIDELEPRSAASTAAASATSAAQRRHGHLHRAAHRRGQGRHACYVQAGGGVVYDSDPDAEYEESVNKAKALRQAARDAALFVGGRAGN